jgi:hypothetical protein
MFFLKGQRIVILVAKTKDTVILAYQALIYHMTYGTVTPLS